MLRASKRMFLPAALAVLFGAAFARAAPIAWSFDSTKSTFSVTGDPGNLGGVSFAALTGSFSGNQTIPILNVIPGASPGGHIDTYSGDVYSVIVDLKDTNSGDPGEFDFTGRLSGSVSTGGVSLSSIFDDPQTVHETLGGHDYAVTIGPFTSPTGDSRGSVSMGVAIDAATTAPPPPPIGKAPEPSAVLLGALGASAAASMGWARRRRLSARTGAA
ncbi:MAG TPA: hypothetical protein VMS17_19010 [Gemmataceae bacterium]|nr:hypothetical protein [Gemmataceae bacterium]